jgi:hypothetical protein
MLEKLAGLPGGRVGRVERGATWDYSPEEEAHLLWVMRQYAEERRKRLLQERPINKKGR